MRVLMSPNPKSVRNGTDGISRVVEAYGDHLPKFGVELVEEGASYDLRAAHAGCTADEVDVCHCHGLYWSADYEASTDELHTNARLISALRVANEVTVPSPWVAENIARDMRFTPHVVPHGIDWDEWQADVPHEGYVLWNKNRTSDVCTPRPLAWLAAKYPSTPFISTFAPDDSLSNITTIGRVPFIEMKGYVQKAGVYLSTTKETFGIGLLEAMASGVPVLSVARGGALSLVNHKETGYLAQSWDDLAVGLDYCLSHRERLGAAAREFAKQYTWDRVCEQVAAIYEQALRPEPPVVTIVIPCYNYMHQVGRTIESVKSQSWPHWECFVVNDGSVDESEGAILHAIGNDQRFCYISQANQGVAHARNNGIAAGSGKYVCCIDADDAIEPSFIETCVKELEENRALGIAYTSILLVRADGYTAPSPWPAEYDFQEQLVSHNQVPTCCVFRRKMWERLGGYRQRYAPQGAGSEDAEFWLRAGAYGFPGKRVSREPLFIYSFLSGSVSGNRRYREENWTAWHPWTYEGQHPFASVAAPKNGVSHLVRQYDEPTVSVIIPVGPGHAHMLVDALDSLEAQTFRNWEAIVINDSGEPLDLAAYPYVRLVETVGKTGAGYARNRGIEVSRAKMFVCLDADDFLQPSYLQTVLDVHRDNQASWIYTDLYILHPNGAQELYHCEDWDLEQLYHSGVASVTCLYAKEMWKDVGGFDEVNNREDWDFHLRLAMAGHGGLKVPQPLLTYRHATGQRREDGSKKKEAQRLRDLYPLKELKEMCKSCGKNKRAKVGSAVLPSNWATKEDLGWPLIEYIGREQNTMVFRGRASGRTYRFGNNRDARFGRVLPEDKGSFLRFTYFREAQSLPADAGPRDVLRAAPAPVKAKPATRDEAVKVAAWEKKEPEAVKAEPKVVKAVEPVKATDKGNGKLDITTYTIKRIQDEIRDEVLTLDELQALLLQENEQPRPRGTMVMYLSRGIRKYERYLEA